MSIRKPKLLVIDVHSDDSAISSAGFLAKLRMAYECHFVLVACSTIRLHHYGDVSRKQRLEEYASFVRQFNGFWHRTNNLPFDADSILDTIPKREIVNAIEQVISQVRPKIMICHGPSFHQDHTIVYEASIAAIRPTARFCPNEVYIAENPTYVHSLGPQTDVKPDFYVSLTAREIERKIACFKKCFPSQVRKSGNYLSPDGIRSWARYRGIEARCQYAEAFETFVRVV